MCRQGAKQILDAVADSGKSVRVVAIAKETLGHEDFVAKFWPAPNELYFDGDPVGLPLFRQANGRSMGLVGGIGNYLVGGTVAKAAKESADTEGNLEGEGKILGTILVINKANEIIMHHTEKVWGDHPKDDELRAAIAKLS
jgi:hypothetical protein